MLNGLKQAVKSVIHKVEQKRREEELKQTQPHVTSGQITEDLHKMGIQKGDILFIHSSLKSLGYVDGGPTAVIQGLLDAVGPDGTLLLPTYYMPGGSILGTCQLEGYVFDPRIHGTNMGAMPEAFLRFSGVHRSIHPTHSVSAIGKHAKYLTEAHHLAPSVFGKGSPWQRFHELNGKVLGIGISMGPVTFYHLLEDTLGEKFPVKVWEDEPYRIPCKGWNDEDYLVPVRPYRPEVTPNRIDHKSREDLRQFIWDDFSQEGILISGSVCSAKSWFVHADRFLDRLRSLAERNITIYSDAEHLSSNSKN
ncbi:MAG: AAC(3) family N-acetyltransferase [Azonexus sp.]|nr:AAC(3) family N-acetyltransferase [Azonexus sp.]MDZ4315963.1 AAC(3) family N-acetyltransferase [Azonexus sp.]